MVALGGSKKIGDGGVRLDVHKPDNDTTTPDLTVPGKDVEELEIPTSLGPLKDQAKATLWNGHGQYRDTPDTNGEGITAGDEVRVFADITADPYTGYGYNYGDNYGEGNTTGMQRMFTGIVRNPNGKGIGAGERQSTLSFTLEDFVGAILSFRIITGGFQERQVAGTDTSILNYILDEKCPEIDTSQIEPIPMHATTRFNAENVMNALRVLVARSQGTMLLASDGHALVVRPVDSVSANFELAAGDFGTYEWKEDDDSLANYIRVDGGAAEASLTTVGGDQLASWSNVTENTREQVQMRVPKSELSSIEIWTDPTRTNSGAGIRVRVQRNEGGAPLEPSDDTKDETHHTLASEFLTEGGFTKFELPANDILREDPWLLVQADDAGDGGGQDIAVTNTGKPLRIVRYPYPVSTRVSAPDSINEYRRREMQVSNNSITSLQEVGEVARAELADRNRLGRTVSFDATTDRAYDLWPADKVVIPYETLKTAGFTGDYVVTERTDSYDGVNLNTSLTLQDQNTL